MVRPNGQGGVPISGYAPSAHRLKVGHITPSSNTVLEPLTGLMSRDYDDRLSHHFTRIKVEAITLEQRHIDQFSADAMLAAADLLSDAAVDAIVWNGTSGAWTGIEGERELCALISERTGVPSSTSTLAQLEVMTQFRLERCGLAVPYTDAVTERVAGAYAREGVHVVSTANAGIHGNRAFAHVSEDEIRALVRAANSPEADCILLVCTGLAGAQLVAELEHELGKPIFDSVAVALWKALRMVGLDPRLEGWGCLFAGAELGVAPVR